APKIDAFELWCWRRLSSVPWTARRSKQSILKEISPGCSLESYISRAPVATRPTETPVTWNSPDGDCSHEIKRRLLLGRKVMTKLDSILKSRDITLPTKVHLVKAMVFPVVMYGCESRTVKKAEHRRLMLLNCGVGEDSRVSLGLQGDPSSPS
uniref:Uncharacterized protein n=1 Tax=Ovis aries TaxID=9940 RepID=A0AC11D6L4_SHEEP